MNIKIDGLDIEYTEVGSGTPVLLLHGWGSSFDVYNGVINTLKNRCRVVAVNFPSCGNSQSMESPWYLDDYCDFVLKFMKAVNLENPSVLSFINIILTVIKISFKSKRRE